LINYQDSTIDEVDDAHEKTTEKDLTQNDATNEANSRKDEIGISISEDQDRMMIPADQIIEK